MPTTPFPRPGRHLNTAVLNWLVYLLFVFGPLLALGSEALQLPAGEAAWMLPGGRRGGLWLNSLALAAAVAATGTLVGWLAASRLWLWKEGLAAHWRWLVLALAPLPLYVHALAWSSTANRLNALLPWPIPFQGWLASWWVQWMGLLPLAVGLALLGLEAIDPALIEAARPLRSDLHVLVQVVLPLAAPAALAGSGFLFLFSLVDYSVPSLFQKNVYALEIFAEYSASNLPGRALLLALPLLLVAAAAMIVSQAPLRNIIQTPPRGKNAWASPPDWPAGFVWLQRAALGLVLLQILVPFVSLVAAVGTWRQLLVTLRSAESEIAFSLLVALLAALLCLPIALLFAVEMKHPRRGKLAWLLTTLPLAVPAPLVGIGLIVIWNRPLPLEIYGSAWMPVLAGAARFAPLATILVFTQMRQINPLLIDAARILQGNNWQTWRQIRLPLLAPGLLAAACLVFALTIGELGATLIVAPPGQATLTLRIYNYLHYGESGVVAGLCLVMVMAALGAGLLIVLLLNRWKHPGELEDE